MPTWSRPPKFFVPVDVVQSSLGPWFDRNHGAHGALHPIQRGAFRANGDHGVAAARQRQGGAVFDVEVRNAQQARGRIAHPR